MCKEKRVYLKGENHSYSKASTSLQIHSKNKRQGGSLCLGIKTRYSEPNPISEI